MDTENTRSDSASHAMNHDMCDTRSDWAGHMH